MFIKAFSNEREVKVFYNFSLHDVLSVAAVVPRRMPRKFSKVIVSSVRNVVVEKPRKATDSFSLHDFVDDADGGKTIFEDFSLRLRVFSFTRKCLWEAKCSLLAGPQPGAKGPRVAGRPNDHEVHVEETGEKTVGFSLYSFVGDAAGGNLFIKIVALRLNIFSQTKKCI